MTLEITSQDASRGPSIHLAKLVECGGPAPLYAWQTGVSARIPSRNETILSASYRKIPSPNMVIKKSLFPLALLIFSASFHAFAQSQYSLDWFKLSGGGGTSTGSVYSITGTIGQHDANSSMSGGNYSLTGGFWSLIGTVQTPGAPVLSVSVTTSNSVLVSWPYPSTGFNLEQNGALGSPNWVAATATPVQVGSQWQALIPSPVGNVFYRLHAR